jgi:biopolymer transport protein ExbB/TolQ
MAAWIWFGLFGVLTNLAAIVLLWAALRTQARERLRPLKRRAIACAVLTTLGAGLGVLFGLIKAFGAVGGESVDPSQKARILAEGISEAINCVAVGLVTGPLPIAVLIAIVVRTRRADAASAP